MTYFDFQMQAQKAKEKNPVWFALTADPPASDTDVVCAENDLQVTLPTDYHHFVRDFGGGYFAFTNVFSVCPSSDWNIVQRNKQYGLDGFIAVSDNGVGDFFGFRVSDGKCLPEIWFWDHEEKGRLKPTGYSNLFEFLSKKGLKCQ